MDIATTNKITKILISTNRGPGLYSLSQLVIELKDYIKHPDFFDIHLDQIYMNILTEKTDTAVNLGVQVPNERKIVIEVLASIDPMQYQTDKGLYLVKLNNTLKKYSVSYHFSVGILDQLPKFAQRAISIQTGIKNCKLLAKKAMVDLIFPLSANFQKLSKEELLTKTSEYDNALKEITENVLDPDKMYELASHLLIKNGYPEIAVRDKDPGALSNSIFNDMVAAKGVLKAMEDKEKTGQASNIYDNIAVILVSLLR